MTKDKRYNDIKRMKKNRYTYKAIGEKYGLCKQRVWQILNEYDTHSLSTGKSRQK